MKQAELDLLICRLLQKKSPKDMPNYVENKELKI